eukprot:1408030-Rhodomonas_salina.1
MREKGVQRERKRKRARKREGENREGAGGERGGRRKEMQHEGKQITCSLTWFVLSSTETWERV